MEHNLLIRNVLRIYLPITILVSLTSTVATFINTFLTGIWLTGDDIVKISVPSFLTLFISVTGSMVATGSSIIFSNHLANGRTEKASNSYSIAVYTALVIGAVFLLVCLSYAEMLKEGVDTPLSNLVSAEYIQAMGVSAIPLLVLQIAIMFLRMDGDKYLALTCFTVYIVIDILSVWLTIQCGNGPFGIGISVAVGAVAALLLVPIHRRIKVQHMVLRKPFDVWNGMKSITKVGFRSVLNRISMSMRYYFLNAFIAATGICAASCLTAQNAVLHLVVAVYTGSAVMAAALCGIYYRQGDRKSLSDTVRELSLMAMGTSVIVAVAVLVLSGGITDLLVSDADARPSALWCLRWFAVSMPTTTLCMILVYAYQATKRKVLASILVLGRGVVMIAAMVLLMAPAIGEAAIWTCFILADVCMLATVVALAAAVNRRLPRSIDDLLILKGAKYESPSLFEGSMLSDRSELEGLISRLGDALREGSVDEDTAVSALDMVERAIGAIIDNGYTDSKVHQIDVLARMDEGLNIIIREDTQRKVEMPDGIRHARTLDLTFHYIDYPRQSGTPDQQIREMC